MHYSGREERKAAAAAAAAVKHAPVGKLQQCPSTGCFGWDPELAS